MPRWEDMVDWERPQRSNWLAQTPMSSGCSWSAKCASGFLSQLRISNRTGLESAFRISSLSMANVHYIEISRYMYRRFSIYQGAKARSDEKFSRSIASHKF